MGYTRMKDLMFGVLMVIVFLIGYILLNQINMKGVEDCSKTYDVNYCKQVMSK